jgi:1-aminocyclopropane-1-carboxylate deaminase
MRLLCYGFLSKHVGNRISRPKYLAYYIPRNVIQFSTSNFDDLMDEVDHLLSELHSKSVTETQKEWRILDYIKVSSSTKARATKASPVEQKTIRNRTVYIKRDDLMRLEGSQISGNKARKMLTMNEISAKDFPTCLVSYGGPQSNAMLALAAIVNYKNRQLQPNVEDDGTKTNYNRVASNSVESNSTDQQDAPTKRFVYYTKTLPRFLRNQPSGNLFRALSLGMELIELTSQEYNNMFESESGGSPEPPLRLKPPVPGDTVWVGIPEAGRLRKPRTI